MDERADRALDQGSAGVPPQLLDGPSARYWAKRAFGVVVVVFAGIVATVGGSFLPEAPRHVVVVIGLTLAIGGAIVQAILALRLRSAQRREKRAGYTTLFDEQFQELWLLDPRTGAVVRRPGEPRT